MDAGTLVVVLCVLSAVCGAAVLLDVRRPVILLAIGVIVLSIVGIIITLAVDITSL